MDHLYRDWTWMSSLSDRSRSWPLLQLEKRGQRERERARASGAFGHRKAHGLSLNHENCFLQDGTEVCKFNQNAYSNIHSMSLPSAWLPKSRKLSKVRLRPTMSDFRACL